MYSLYRNFCLKDGRKSKSNISFIKEMKAYGTRYNAFSFIERKHGTDTNRFEGVNVVEDWDVDDIRNKALFASM